MRTDWLFNDAVNMIQLRVAAGVALLVQQLWHFRISDTETFHLRDSLCSLRRHVYWW